mgnify:CR=1 FL=1
MIAANNVTFRVGKKALFEDVNINPNKVVLDLNIDELKIDNKVLSKNIDLMVLELVDIYKDYIKSKI